MKKINMVLRKCKGLRLGRSLSCGNLRTKSTEELWMGDGEDDDENSNVNVFVGSTRKQYTINSKYVTHPLLNALINKSTQEPNGNYIIVKCEVVLFDHLLWMLDNTDPKISSESLEELAELYTL